MKKIVLTAGGTGGHIYPALSVAEELKKREIEVLFIGTCHRMEKDIIPNAGYRFIGYDVLPMNGMKPLLKMIKSVKEAFFMLNSTVSLLSLVD